MQLGRWQVLRDFHLRRVVLKNPYNLLTIIPAKLIDRPLPHTCHSTKIIPKPQHSLRISPILGGMLPPVSGL